MLLNDATQRNANACDANACDANACDANVKPKPEPQTLKPKL